LIWLHNIDLCKAEHIGLVKCYVFRKHCMKQAHRPWYVLIDSYLVTPRRCVDPNLYFKSGSRYDFDFGFYTDSLFLIGSEPLMIKVWGRWLLKFKMKNDGMMNQFINFGKENLYCKSIEEFLESKNVHLLKSFWKVKMQILGHSNQISRSYEETLLNLTWQPTVDWRIYVSFEHPSVYVYVVHRTWVNSWLSRFIHIELPPSTLRDIFMGRSIFGLRYSSHNMDCMDVLMMTGIIIDEMRTSKCCLSMRSAMIFWWQVHSFKHDRGWVRCG